MLIPSPAPPKPQGLERQLRIMGLTIQDIIEMQEVCAVVKHLKDTVAYQKALAQMKVQKAEIDLEKASAALDDARLVLSVAEGN